MALLSRYDGNYYTPESIDSTGFTPFLGTDPRALGLNDWQSAANYIEARFGPAAIGYAGMHGYFDAYFPSTYDAAAQSSLGGQVASGQAARDQGGTFGGGLGGILKTIVAVPAAAVGGLSAAAALTGADFKTAVKLDAAGLIAGAAPLAPTILQPAVGKIALTTALGGEMDLKDLLRSALVPVLGGQAGELLGGGVIGDLGNRLVDDVLNPSVPQQVALGLPALGALPSMAARFLPSMATVGRGVAAAVGVIRSVGGRILGVVLPSGMRVGPKAAIQLAKSMGITAAATALGIGAADLAEMVLQHAGKHRRGRGVTGAQLRTTRRTMRTVERMHRQIVGYCHHAGVGTHHRRAAPRVIVAAPARRLR